MEIANNHQDCIDMESLCNSARTYIMAGNYESGMELICQYMEQYPHAPQPHNLLGIVMEKTGKHHAAMKHFKAALALDPEYLPVIVRSERPSVPDGIGISIINPLPHFINRIPAIPV